MRVLRQEACFRAASEHDECVNSRPIHRILGSAFFGAVGLMALGGAGTVLHVQSPLFRPLGIALAACLAALFLAGSVLFLVFPFREGVQILRGEPAGALDRFASWCAGGPDEIDGSEPDGGAKAVGAILFALYSLLAWTVLGATAWQLLAWAL